MRVLRRVLVLFFAITAVRTSASFAQPRWFWQNPLPQGNTLFAAAAPCSNTVVAVGEVGTILRTTDGGATWTPQSSGTTRFLRGVSFADANTGWAVGDGGTILRSSDGGVTWTPQSSGRIENLRAVSFVDANTGTAVGGEPTRPPAPPTGIILRTTDGGATWAPQVSRL